MVLKPAWQVRQMPDAWDCCFKNIQGQVASVSANLGI